MKRTVLFALLCAATMSLQAAGKITRIDPTNWYAGLKDASLQLMVYGEGVADATVTTDYANVRIDSLVRLDSPNYLFIYLNLEGAEPGEMTLRSRMARKRKR